MRVFSSGSLVFRAGVVCVPVVGRLEEYGMVDTVTGSSPQKTTTRPQSSVRKTATLGDSMAL